MSTSSTVRIMTILCFIVFLGACKKDPIFYTLNCHVTDLSESEGLSGATVIVKIFYTAGAGQNSQTTYLTDNSGNINISIERKRIDKIVIDISKNGYFSASRTLYLDDLSVEDSNAVDFSIFAESWVKLRFIGDGSINYQFFRELGLENCSACFPNGLQTLSNVTDTSLYYINNGNTPFQVFWSVVGTTINGQENVITTSQDTTEILIAN